VWLIDIRSIQDGKKIYLIFLLTTWDIDPHHPFTIQKAMLIQQWSSLVTKTG